MFLTRRRQRRARHVRTLQVEQFESRLVLATITVDTLSDESDGSIGDGDVSLRDAIAASAHGDLIQFAPSLDGGTIRLTDGELTINVPLTVDASMLTSGLTVDAELRGGVLLIEYQQRSELATEIRGLSLTGADAKPAIESKEPLIVRASRITGNASDGVHASETLSIFDSEIIGNRGHGVIGAWYVTVKDSVVADNSQDGIKGYSSDVVDSVVTGNGGTGIAATYHATASHSTVAKNGGQGISGSASAGATDSNVMDNDGYGVLSNFGDAYARSSTISGNGGHGIQGWWSTQVIDSSVLKNDGDGVVGDRSTSGVKLVRSSIADNGGNGVRATGLDSGIDLVATTVSGNQMSGVRGRDVTVQNSTISGNGTQGISTLTARVTHGTIIGNDHGISIASADGSPYNQISNSIIAGNMTSDISLSEDAQPDSWLSHNLIGDNTGSGLTEAPLGSPNPGGNIIGDPNGEGVIDPILSALGSFGGSVPTHVPLPNSPVIDAGGELPEEVRLDFDQRGFQRNGNGRADIGSTESQSNFIDFNGDGELNCTDIDELTMSVLAADNLVRFDLNKDSLVDNADVEAWLTLAGIADSPTNTPYSRADVNLDGQVDPRDLNEVAKNWHQPAAGFCSGDIVVDGVVDAADLNQIGLHWPRAVAAIRSPRAAAVGASRNLIRDHVFSALESDGKSAKTCGNHEGVDMSRWRPVDNSISLAASQNEPAKSKQKAQAMMTRRFHYHHDTNNGSLLPIRAKQVKILTSDNSQ